MFIRIAFLISVQVKGGLQLLQDEIASAIYDIHELKHSSNTSNLLQIWKHDLKALS
jgi:hypothetical protein